MLERAQRDHLHLSSVIKNFFTYACGAFMLRSASVLVTPLTLHLLSPDDYGLISLMHSFASIVIALIGFGLRQLLLIEYFHQTRTQRYVMVNHLIHSYLILALPLFIGGLSTSSLINQYLFVGAAPPLLIAITLTYCFISFFVELLYQLLMYQGKARTLTYVQTGSALSIIGCNVVLLVWCHAGVYSTMIGHLVGYTLVACWGMYHYLNSPYRSVFNVRATIRVIPTYLMMGLPFMPSVVCTWVMSSSNRWFLARMTTMHDVGIYALADAFGQLYLLIILQPLNNAYLPHLMRTFSDNKDNLVPIEQRNRTLTLYSMLAAVGIITVGYSVGKPVLCFALPLKYHEALHHVWLILMGYVLLTGTYCFSAFIQFHKHTWFLACALCIPALCNSALNLFFIPIWGVNGCVIATVSAQALYCGITYWYGSRLLNSIRQSSAMKFA